MCGRFAITLVHGFFTRFAVEVPEIEVKPRYNIAPTQDVPIIIGPRPNHAVMMRWGLIPFWAKDPKIGNRLINARAETVATKPAFRASLKRRRCLVPATGFYEWKRMRTGKEPFFIRRKDGELFSLAGLYDRWHNPESGETVTSFTIVTTTPNRLLAAIHNRMPVILLRDDEEVWLSSGALDDKDLRRLLTPIPARGFEAYRVSTDANNLANEYPELIEPLSHQ